MAEAKWTAAQGQIEAADRREKRCARAMQTGAGFTKRAVCVQYVCSVLAVVLIGLLFDSGAK